MTDRFSIALAQINPVPGDVAGNIALIRAAWTRAAEGGAGLLVCPASAMTGVPLADPALWPFGLEEVEAAVEALAAGTAGGPALLVGAPWRREGRLHDAALLLDGGRVAAARFRVGVSGAEPFAAGPVSGPMSLRGLRVGVAVGGDLDRADVIETLAETGAEILIVPGDSPFTAGGPDRRLQAAVRRVTETGLPLVHVNAAGGQGERVYDGASFALRADRSLAAQAPSFREHLAFTRWERREDEFWTCLDAETHAPPEGPEAVWRTLVLGLRDHVTKNGFSGALIHLSGGLGPALAAAVAADALGPEGLWGVAMPGPGSVPDGQAAETARLLGCRFDAVPLDPVADAIAAMLFPLAPGGTGIADLSRLRGAALSSLAASSSAGRPGPMLLAGFDGTDLSEGAAGLKADLCADYAVLKDISRTQALALARWRNGGRPAGLLGPAGPAVPVALLAGGAGAGPESGPAPAEARHRLRRLAALRRGAPPGPMIAGD
ncbi:nitrilase-related carbon-nitrogen hydrolase [Azospirillum sp. SYSU D00513]|uniref:nitrilase-related carbon-nitrogen hydrolase n=1 Tax=Azospirillum sp. SYSU D00513 TaxID=2812561 RepID=UPI001A97C543|nr:nitrilase-related carbon-nitrogen hydrolase [Azospirillum sp. SYSU D00513]